MTGVPCGSTTMSSTMMSLAMTPLKVSPVCVEALSSVWLGFLIVFAILLAVTAGAFLFAWRKMKVGSPAPKMAIEEAKKIRETVSTKGNGG